MDCNVNCICMCSLLQMDHYDHDDVYSAALEMAGLIGEGRGLSAPLGLKAAARKYKVCQPELNAYFQSVSGWDGIMW